MRKEYVGQNEDGTPRYNYIAEGDEVLVVTNGPLIVGVHEMSDGTVYDVNDACVGVAPDHFDELHHAIAKAVSDRPDNAYEYDEDAVQADVKAMRIVLDAFPDTADDAKDD